MYFCVRIGVWRASPLAIARPTTKEISLPFDFSEEGGIQGLGLFPGSVVRFRRPPTLKVPHMGWNSVRFLQPNAPLARGLRPDGETFYFVHSFHCVPVEPNLVLAECDYGGTFCAAISRGRVSATQFHPEKSQASGLRVYRNFVALTAGAPMAEQGEPAVLLPR